MAEWIRRAAAGCGAALLLTIVVVALSPAVANATAPCPTGVGSGGATYTTPDSETRVQLPAGVAQECVLAVGAFGGDVTDGEGDTFYGGQSAAVTSWVGGFGPSFYVEVGSAGGAGYLAADGSPMGGAAGAPNGGDGGLAGPIAGAGGGGESDVRLYPLSDTASPVGRILVAGGGGGAGAGGDGFFVGGDGIGGGGAGGSGGGVADPTSSTYYAAAADGTAGVSGSAALKGGVGGGGGSLTGGTSDASPGGGPSSGVGGSALDAQFAELTGGGGGGGYSGGGGGGSGETNGLDTGGGGGGGGGSSYVEPALLIGGDEPTFSGAVFGGVSHAPSVTLRWLLPRTLAYSPHSGLSFPAQTVGNGGGAALSVLVSNGAGAAETVGTTTVGGEPLAVSGVAVAGTDPGDYSASAVGCGAIPAQGGCTIHVTFAAQGMGDRPATLQFSSDDPAMSGPVSVALDGTGIARSTTTAVNCPPGSTTVGATLTCTITVTDPGSGSVSTPTGTVSLTSDSAGAVANPGDCALVSTGTTGQASCSLTYTPSAVGSGFHTLTAGYSGDSRHASSSGVFMLAVSGLGSSIGPSVSTTTTTSATTSSGGTSGGSTTTTTTTTQMTTAATTTHTPTVTNTATLIERSLAAQLTPTGPGAAIGALGTSLHYVFSFTPLTAGTLRIAWYYLPAGAHLAKAKNKAEPVLVAVGTLRFAGARASRFTVKLTAAGKHLLKHAHHLKLTAEGVFTPSGGAGVSATRPFTLAL